MANFNTHFNVAFAVTGLSALTFFKAGIIDAEWLLLCVAAGTIGGLLPDLDSDNSTPLTVGFTFISTLIAFGVTIATRSTFYLLELIAIWIVVFMLMRLLVFKLFTGLTIHRGVMHSIPYVLLFGLISTYIAFYAFHASSSHSWLIGGFVSLGALVHLILDELYSVDLTNMALKRSFGTALKLIDWQQWYWYVGLYALLIVGFYFAPSAEQCLQLLCNPKPWQQLWQQLIHWPS